MRIFFLCWLFLLTTAHPLFSEEDASVFLKREIEKFHSTYPDLRSFSPQEIASLIKDWQSNSQQKLRPIDVKNLEECKKLFSSGKGIILMRHGEQKVSEIVASLPSPALQKIEMMRLPNNLTDPITMPSAIELFGTLICLDYLKQTTGKTVIIQSSHHMRARQVAEAIAAMLSTECVHNPLWDCLNYPNELQLSTTSLLQLIPDGTLPWEKSVVDSVVKPGTFAGMESTVEAFLSSKKEDAILICVTHTQQMNIACKWAGLPVQRTSFFSFVYLPDHTPTKLFSSGFYE